MPAPPRPPVNIWKPAFLAALRTSGVVTYAANAAGIDRTTAYQARWRSAKFARLWDEAIEEANDMLEAVAIQRATEGVNEPVYYQGEVVGHVRKPSDSLLQFILKGRRPETFRDHHSIQHSGELGHHHTGEVAPRKVTIEFVRTGVESDPDSPDTEDDPGPDAGDDGDPT